MKRATNVTMLLAAAFLAAAPYATAQNARAGLGTGNCLNPRDSKTGGQVAGGGLGATDVSSAKFTEYREVPEGPSLPCFNIFTSGDRVDFNALGYNVGQSDQRYAGWFKMPAFDLTFDYNQIPHNKGNGGLVILQETSPGVWAMSDTLQRSLGTVNDAMPSASRTVAFYDALLASTFPAAGGVDISSTRKRGMARLDLGKKLPFDLSLTYMRELKSGYRGDEGGGVYSAVNSVLEVPSPLDEVTQDLGVQAAYDFGKGNLHGSFSRNLYDNRAETLTVDNPFQWFDTAYVTTPAPAVGGGSQARWINAPDNEASTGNLGFLLKFGRQTRIGGDLTVGRWTQNAPFYPYTINSAILTPNGVPANSLSALQRPSFNGKIDTTTINFNFTSRPIKQLGLRAQFRSYDLANKTDRFVITGDVAASPDRAWSVVTPSADAPYGHATANHYDTKTTRFTAAASYDIGDFTLEAQGRFANIERTSREAHTGDENAFVLTALYRAKGWLNLRASYEEARRTATGETYYGFQADEADRDTTRVGAQLDFTLPKNVDLSFGYFLRDVTYPNRPDRIAMSSGAPMAGAAPIPNTPSGLLLAKYDSITAEINYSASERANFGAYYTHERDRTTNQFSTTSGTSLNNLLNYAGNDKTDTFGLFASFQFKPEVWRFSVNALRQKVDGMMDITAREAGSFYTPGRSTLIPAGTGGAADITDWDDTQLTTINAQLDYTVAKTWTLSAGYWYEKYTFTDAFTAGNLQMPQMVLIFMKPDRGPYDVNVAYAKVSYRF